MKDWNSSAIGILGVLAFLLIGCSSHISPTSATLEANTYSNHLFKFQIQLPQGWTINDKASYRKAAAWQDSDSQESEATDAAEGKISKQLLFISELPFGAPAESNDSIVMIAVDLSGEPNFKTAKDYQVLLINSLKTNDESRKLVKEPFLTKLGAKEFWRTDFEINVLSQGLYQANFTTLEKRHALLIAVTADSKEEVDKILTLAGFPKTGQ